MINDFNFRYMRNNPRDVIDKFDPVLKSYKFVRRHVECTPINQYDQFLSQFMDVCLTLSMKKKTKIK